MIVKYKIKPFIQETFMIYDTESKVFNIAYSLVK